MEVTEVMLEDAVGCGCCGEERHGGDRGYVRRCSRQGVVVRRDMEVTEVMSEDAVGRVLW